MKRPALLALAALSALLPACDSSILAATQYRLGGSVSGLQGSGLVLQNAASGEQSQVISISANGSFQFNTSLVRGAAYLVTVKSQPVNPTQTCTVSNGSGSIGQFDVTNVLVNCAPIVHFAYVANRLSNNISAYQINPTTGALTPVPGSPFVSPGSAPQSVAVDHSGSFLFVANGASNNVSAFTISATGVLSLVGSAVPAGSAPSSLAIDASDGYLYVSNSASNDVSAYAINASSGALTELANSPFPVGVGPVSLAVDPAGDFLYVANSGSGNVSVLQIDSATGTLKSISGSPFPAGRGAISIAIDTAGTSAYVANQTGTTVSAYSINPATGAMTAIGTLPVLTEPTALAIDSSAPYLYAANAVTANSVATLSINASGALAVSGTPASTGATPVSLAIGPSGQFLYAVSAGTNDVYVYSIDAGTGVLTPAAPSFISAGIEPQSIAID